jgi:hypothetical protein
MAELTKDPLYYFNNDFKKYTHHSGDYAVDIEGASFTVSVKIFFDFLKQKRSIAIYIPYSKIIGEKELVYLTAFCDHFLDRSTHTHIGEDAPPGTVAQLKNLGNGKIEMLLNIPGDPNFVDTEKMKFDGTLFMYGDFDVDTPSNITKNLSGRELIFRGLGYAKRRSSAEAAVPNRSLFISHDSRDKEVIARPLASSLQKLGCNVWFDEFSLHIGDSLRESIERGLLQCGKCLFIITPNFLAKGGWPKREYDSIFTREIVENSKLILPIWHGVEVRDVFEYSPILADRVALQWRMGCDTIASKVYRSLER